MNLKYSYNSIGNILSNSLVWEYSYLNGTNPHSVTQVGNKTLQYDNNGNVKKEIENGIIVNLIYNSKQELVTSQIGTGTFTNYLYDNNSKRVEKSTGNNVNRYIDKIYEVENDTTRKYIFLNGNKVATIEDEEIVYNLSDHLGGASIDVNQNGDVLQVADYFPYGSERLLVRTLNYENNYLFTGKELDGETSLQYFEVRYYNPENGRFYSQDRVFWEIGQTKRGKSVLADPQQLNAYSYARNNPIIYTDPSGEIVEQLKQAGTAVKNAAFDTGAGMGLNMAMGAGYVSKINTNNNLGISGEMLNTFMYGDGSFKNYGKGDAIYDKVMQTDLYKDQINLAIQEVLKTGKNWTYGKNGSTTLTETDLYYSVKKVDWAIGASMNNNGQVETTFLLRDTYDFAKDNYFNPLGGTLNSMGYWYQERGLGTSYRWELKINETFNINN